MDTKFADVFEGIISLKLADSKSTNEGGDRGKSPQSIGVQSESVPIKEREAQTDVGKSIETQTDDLLVSSSSKISISTTNTGQDDDPSFNWHTLNDFLLRIEPTVLRTLADNRRTWRLFEAYDRAAALAEESESNVVLEYVLKSTDYWPAAGGAAQPMALSWNSSGTTIGVACGRIVHEDWCTHPGFVMTWNIDRSRLNPTKADHVYETGSCCTCLCFHPRSPHLFATCNYTGTVAVWSLLEEGDPIARSDNRQQQHQQSDQRDQQQQLNQQSAINCVCWAPPAPGEASDNWAVASGGADGMIVLWTLPGKGGRTLIPTKTFQTRVANLPRSVRGKVSGEAKPTGTTSLSFARAPLASRFAVGTETGGVFQCSTDNTIPIDGNPAIGGGSLSTSCYDPVVLCQKPHIGPVYKAAFHPREPSALATCGADGVVRLGAAFRTLPCLEVDCECGTLFDLSWSPCRPCVFACAPGDGRLLVFDLTRATDRPVIKMEPGGAGAGQGPSGGGGGGTKTEGTAMLAAAFNPRRGQVLATADTSGYVKIWNLGDTVGSMQPREDEKLRELLAAGGGGASDGDGVGVSL